MKIICTQENLRAGLLVVGRIISNSNTLPILNNILLKTENGQLKLSATNLEIAISTKIRCKIEEEGSVCVPAKTITDLVNSLPNANITLTTKNNELSVHTDNYQTGIKSFPSEEFPLIPNVEGQHSITIDPIELKKSIDMVVFAASNNETQPEISGLFLSGDGNQLKVVATDRYRLAEKSTTTQSKETIREVIIPQKAALEISRIVAASPAQTKLVINDNQIAVTIGETEIVSRLIDGQYPDYKQIIPDTFATNITIPRTELIAALKTAGIFSKTSHSVNLSYDAKKSTVTISAASSDVGESVVEVHAVVDGPDGVVAFNHYYLLDALQTISGGEVVFKLNDDSQAVVITPKEKADYLYLVMPIKH